MYSFELMGKKLSILHHSPESIIAQYTNFPNIITEVELMKLLRN